MGGYDQLDPTLALMLFLKKSWTETNPARADIQFTTAPMAEPARYPQIQVTKRKRVPNTSSYSSRGAHQQLNIGTNPVYWVKQPLFVDIYVRPDYSSNTSIGQSKDQRWNMTDEVRRILTYNPTGSTNIDYTRIDDVADWDEMAPRPTILHTRMLVTCFQFRTGSA